MPNLSDAWLAYQWMVIPTAGPAQVQETKRAFYGGAYSALCAACEPGDPRAEKFVQECNAFMASVEAGKA